MKIEQIDATIKSLSKRVSKPKKEKKPKEPRDLRYMFRKNLKELSVDKIKRPWMAQKSFRLISAPEVLQKWVDNVLNDTSRHIELNGALTPVVAVDTEGTGLDTRIFVDRVQKPDGSWDYTYEVNVEVSGVCLSADGIEGIYIPITHEIGDNIDREACAKILQYLFDHSHLVFYNAKYDKEVFRITMGISFRPYPHFEDVQILRYINDPKADLGDKGAWTGDSGGLKALSKNILGLEQIEMEELTRVKCDYCPVTASPYCSCTPEQRKEHKHSLKNTYAPFSWVPTELALWYAAGDAICTWLLWKGMYELARSRKSVHNIDHELSETVTWIERQRWVVDTNRLARTSKGHAKKLVEMRDDLRQIALRAGYVEIAQDDGTVIEENKFNPGSTQQLQTLLFKIKGFEVTKLTPKGTPSCDAEALEDLFKLHPEDEFLQKIMSYRDYTALHPDNLCYDKRDSSARIYLKQNIVAGGRFSAAGGEFAKDGGFGLNPQGIKKIESYLQWKVQGNVLDPDEIPVDQIEEYEESDLHPSCFREKEKDGVVTKKKAPGIIKNHIGQYMGYTICLVPKCTSCADKFGILIPDTKLDANEMVNLRALFYAPPGFTMFCIDYGNIEMRCAANVSGEPEFIKEFLEGSGDFHSLTASKVFPEFNDPNTSKAMRKSYRDLAKIINFALLYGGTEYTIFENMKKKKPDITRAEAKDMYTKYWAGVPVFHEFCQMKQNIAKNEMLCKTATGRVIDFKSAMEAQHIHEPSEEEMDNYWTHRNYKKKAEEAKKDAKKAEKENPSSVSKYKELERRYEDLATRLWKNPDTGVRNAIDYNKFLGKIQRVSVNVPLQGLAGDFMRMALNRIRKWVESDPLIQTVFHLHCSVHDEIDFIVKNEYVPFILPRLTRLMKLRTLHTKMKWPVPIECDAEYGQSWDVEHHVTGDSDHKAAAWTEIKGAANYIPEDWDSNTLKNLIKAVASGEEPRILKAKSFLEQSLHPRAFTAANAFFEAKDDKARKKALIALVQLDEYWRIDHTPDEDEDKLETFAQYEQRNELGPEFRDWKTPPFGYLGAIPLTANVSRPKIPLLGEEYPPEQLEVVVSEDAISVSVKDEPVADAPISDEPSDSERETPRSALQGVLEEVNLLKAVTEPAAPVSLPVEPPIAGEGMLVALPADGIPTYELRDLDEPATVTLKSLLGAGKNTIRVLYKGQIKHLVNKRMDKIPEQFLKSSVYV